MTLIIFIAILGLLIFVHELGHFLVAKRNKIGVEEFAFGFPPRVFCRKVGETKYCLNLVPLGGYVKLVGEDTKSKAKNAFNTKSVGARAAVIVAGVIMNFILAAILLGIGFGIGMDTIASDPATLPGEKQTRVVVTDFSENSPAKAAGLEAGDVLLDFQTTEQLQQFTQEQQGQTVELRYQRLGEEAKTGVALTESEAPLGVFIHEAAKVKMPFWQAIGYGFVEAYRTLVLMLQIFWTLLSQLIQGNTQLASQVSGPVGIYNFTGMAVQMGAIVVLQLTALLSINLAIINILPFPALDGGKLLFLGLEKVFKKRVVREEVENVIHFIGFALLILLIVFITYRDVLNLR